jgi:hypothetical protein
MNEKIAQPNEQPQTDQRIEDEGGPGDGFAALGLCVAATALLRLQFLNSL